MYVRPTAPRSIGGVIDDGIRLWRSAYAKTWFLALIAQLAVAIPLLLFRVPVVPGAVQNPQALLAMYRSPMFWLFYIVAILVGSGLYNAIVAQTAAGAENRDSTAGDSVSIGFRLLPRTILLGLVMVVAGAVLALAFFLPSLAFGVMSRFLLAALLILLIAFLVVRILLAVPVLIVDDAGVFDSLRSSWTLTQGHWWRTATILTVVTVIFVVLLMIIAFLGGIAAALVGPASAAAAVIGQLISIVGNTVATPLFVAVLLSILFDLKLRKEGGDLADRVSALASR